MSSFKLLIIYLIFFITISSCKEELNRPLAPPSPLTVASFSPTSGYPFTGIFIAEPTIVTITGTGFSPDIKGNTVMFGDIKAKIVSASPSMIQVEEPSALIYDSYFNPEYKVSVSAFGFTAVAPGVFTLN